MPFWYQKEVVSRARVSSLLLLVSGQRRYLLAKPRPQTQEPDYPRRICHILINLLQGSGHLTPQKIQTTYLQISPCCGQPIPAVHSWLLTHIFPSFNTSTISLPAQGL